MLTITTSLHLTPFLSEVPGHTMSNLVTILFRSLFGLKAKRNFSFVGWTRTLELLESISNQCLMCDVIEDRTNFTIVGESVLLYLFSSLRLAVGYFSPVRNTNTASGILPILHAIQSTICSGVAGYGLPDLLRSSEFLKSSNPITATKQKMGSVCVQNALKHRNMIKLIVFLKLVLLQRQISTSFPPSVEQVLYFFIFNHHIKTVRKVI